MKHTLVVTFATGWTHRFVITPDNLISSTKAVQDAMVNGGVLILPDHTWINCELVAIAQIVSEAIVEGSK